MTAELPPCITLVAKLAQSQSTIERVHFGGTALGSNPARVRDRAAMPAKPARSGLGLLAAGAGQLDQGLRRCGVPVLAQHVWTQAFVVDGGRLQRALYEAARKAAGHLQGTYVLNHAQRL